MHDSLYSRRGLLSSATFGVGGLALASLIQSEGARAETVKPDLKKPTYDLLPKPTLHPPKARAMISLFMQGGPSHMDLFDPKPELNRLDGKKFQGEIKYDNAAQASSKVLGCPWKFEPRGQSGIEISELLPHTATIADDITLIRSMFTGVNNHGQSIDALNTGRPVSHRPSLGSWLTYGLGAENQDLPAFVVLPDPRGLPAGGSINWTSGFLPANHQGVGFRTGTGAPIANLESPSALSAEARTADLRLLAQMDRDFAQNHPGDEAFASRLRSYELAARMQVSIPEAVSIETEPPAVRALYGLDDPANKGFARNCLLARRLLERGVRFVQIFNGGSFGSPRINWDGHENLRENHDAQAATMDRPVAALIQDLKQRGMLEDTLFVWSTEFGRSPATQGIDAPGRDHHPSAFTCFLAGAGVKAGYHHGSSDEIGYFVGEDKVTVPDFHATILHLLGIDHKRLTFYHNGINRRLTDVHGDVISDLLS